MSAAQRGTTPAPAAEEATAERAPQRPGSLGIPPPARTGERRLGAGGRRASDRGPHDEAGLAQERSRIAADVHDLVMQDVSFALATARSIAGDPALAERYAAAAVAAGERALAGARTIVKGLSAGGRRCPVALVRESVLLAARDTPLTLETHVGEDEDADEPTTFALLHIAREAVTNAVKHAAPETIHVTLARADEWHLRVRDDGCGFDRGRVRPGFGLDSARRHAEGLGGRLLVSSEPGAGTVVEVFLP